MPPETAIEAVGLRFRYGREWAVDGVSLDIARGEVLCVIGANGAGKTTLLSLLGGMAPAIHVSNRIAAKRQTAGLRIEIRVWLNSSSKVYGLFA